MTDYEAIIKTLNDFLFEYNSKNANKINIVLFDDCVYHLSKIVRITNFEMGHALLIGIGGNGRTSLVTLSAFI